MQNHQLDSAGSASDQAIEWLARLRADDVTPQETADFAIWLAASQENQQAFDNAAEIWQLTARMPVQSVTLKPRKMHRYGSLLPLATAASVLFAAFMMVLQLATPSFATGKGEQRRVVLADGSIAFMNTASKIQVHYSADERRIVLQQGEVWFDVARNAQRPFTVDGRYADAKAVGTAFSVRETPGFTRVTVTEGAVVLLSDNGQQSPHLGPGDESTVSATATDYQQVDPEIVLSWQRGQLVYNDVRLDALLKDLNRYLPKTMTINDQHLEGLRVSAVLNLDDQEAMLEALSRTLPIRWKSLSDTLIIVTSST
ncbi:MAG: FecR domain-containing protein [Pseudomonadaceae bacterium]|nr:FecR domain-containing protein [Pseudomonadaceae bacterium]